MEEQTLILLSVIFLNLVAAFFSAAETGITASSRAKIHRLKQEGNKRAELVSKLRKDKDRLIGAILLGNNVVNIFASALATSAAIAYFGEEGVYYATAVMTVLIIVFTEVLPKSFAFRNAERVSLAIAPILSLVVKILLPLTTVVQWIVDIILRIFGVQNKEGEMEGTEMLRGAIDLHHREGAVVKQDRDMLGSILDLQETEVGEIMVHRRLMETIDFNLGSEAVVDAALASGHTRLPVWKDDPDNIIGILHVKELIKALTEHDDDISTLNISSILLPPWYVPETTLVKEQLQAFLRRRNHFALVVDEYGSLQGHLTLEDVLEEIVGQIRDEHDEGEKSGIRRQKDGFYLVEGTVTLRDLNRELDWDLPADNAATVAGLVIHEAQIIPHVGQVFQFHGYRFEIMKRHRNQVVSLRIKRTKQVEVEDDGE